MDRDNFYDEDLSKAQLKETLFKYLRYWKWIFLSVVVSIVLGFLFLRYTPSQYSTSGKIKILETEQGLSVPTEFTDFFGQQGVNLENEIHVIKSNLLLEKVVLNLDLQVSYFSKGRVKDSELWDLPFKVNFNLEDSLSIKPYKFYVKFFPNKVLVFNDVLTDTLSYNELDKLGFFSLEILKPNFINRLFGETIAVNYLPLSTTLNKLKNGLIVTEAGKKSEILSLKITGTNKLKNEAIINAVIEQFNLDGVEDRQLVFERTINFVDERFEFLSTELDSIEVNKKEFKKDYRISFIEADAQASLLTKNESTKDLFNVETQVMLVNLLEENLDNTSEKLLPSNIGLSDNSLNVLISEYNDKVLKAQNLLSGVGENHPSYILISEEIIEIRQSINSSIAVYKKQLQASLAQIKEQQKKASGDFLNIPESEKLLRSIERQQQIKESLYLLLLQKREEAAINLAVTTPSIKVVDYAVTEPLPISPKKPIILLGSFLLGLILPIGILYVLFFLDTKIHSKNDIAKQAPNISIAGEIPHIEENNTIFLNKNDRTVLAESFRILATNINYLLPPSKNQSDSKIIYTTSTIKGEGKTYVSLNLALSLAHMNKKVLLIGADLRNPQLHGYFNINKSGIGLSRYLHDYNVDWRDCLTDIGINLKNFDVILSGAIPPNPTEQLSSGRLNLLIEEAKKEYDIIMVDTAPTLLVSDTLLISNYADLTLYVTRANKTEVELLKYSKALYEDKKLKNIAYIVNDVGSGKKGGYGYGYGYSYGYNYGYGYGYGESEKRKPWFKKLIKS